MRYFNKARNSKNGSKFIALFDYGDISVYDDDDSDADAGLAGILAFWTNGDRDQMERLMRQSALHRDKFDRPDYLPRTFDFALKDKTEFYDKRRSQHHNVPNKTPVMFNHRKNPVAISFSTGGRPEPRRWVVDNILPERFPTTLYGDSGKAKSFVASHIGQSVADPECAEWIGYPVQSGPVLYLDFEMDEIEQRRRAYDVAAGRGETTPPEDFLYMECVEYTPEAVFNATYDLCVERGVKLVIIDSMDMAIEGGSETSSDTNAFYRDYICPLRSLGVAVLVIDHQAKKQKGENYVDKDIFGSTYKKANSRNVFQINGEMHANQLRATLRHTKANLGPQLDPIHIGITFEGGCVTIGGREADTAGASQSDLIALYLSDYGPSTAAAIAEALGMGEGTVRNRLGEMNGKRVEKAGKVDRAQLWRVLNEHHNEDTRDVVSLGSSPELTEDPSADAA